MELLKISDKNFAKLKFIFFFSMSVLLSLVILSSFWGPIPSLPQDVKESTNKEMYEVQQILKTDRMLHSKWMRLEQLYSEQALYLSDPSKIDHNVAGKLAEAEESFNKTLITIEADNSTLAKIEKIDSIVNFFWIALQNRQALNNNFSEIALKNTNKSGNLNVDDIIKREQKLNELQNDLQAKTNMIAKLQSQLKSQPVPNTRDGSMTSKEIKKMKDEIEFLKWALRSEVSSNHSLTKSNEQLKRDHASLLDRLK